MTCFSGFRRYRAIVLPLALAGLASPRPGIAQDVRVRDLTVEEGTVPVRLLGYGLVVGLSGTGDRPGGGRGSVHTVQSVANLLRRFGIDVPTELLATRNVAAVLVTAEVSPFLRPGGRFDVTVASVGDARSLRGGALWMTPLVVDAGGQSFGSAQGTLRFADTRLRWGQAESSAQIPAAGVLEMTLPQPATPPADRLLLKQPDRVNASRVADAINASLGKDVAQVEDPGAIKLTLKQGPSERAEQLSRIAELRLRTSQRALLVLDARDGTVSVGGQLIVGAASVTHGGISLTVGSAAAAGTGTTTAPDSTSTLVRVAEGAPVQEVVAALAAFHLRADEVSAFLQALVDLGALDAEISVR